MGERADVEEKSSETKRLSFDSQNEDQVIQHTDGTMSMEIRDDSDQALRQDPYQVLRPYF